MIAGSSGRKPTVSARDHGLCLVPHRGIKGFGGLAGGRRSRYRSRPGSVQKSPRPAATGGAPGGHRGAGAAASRADGKTSRALRRSGLTRREILQGAQHGPTSSDPACFILTPAGYPRTGPGTPGLMILDRHGSIVWYSPNTGFPASKGEGRMDLKVQTYRGRPVLTWWQGQVITGYGEGRAMIADSSYRTIATAKAGNGLQADLHEFVISAQDTALITAYRQVTTNLLLSP
jgi:hypothetical protein